MITKDQVQKFQTELGVVLEELCKKHGMSVGKTRIVYNDVTFKLNVEFGEASSLDGVNPVYYNHYLKNHWRFGIKTPTINLPFNYNGTDFEIRGMKNANTFLVRAVKINTPHPTTKNIKVGGVYGFSGDEVRKCFDMPTMIETPMPRG
jgi:hypothetical protein